MSSQSASARASPWRDASSYGERSRRPLCRSYRRAPRDTPALYPFAPLRRYTRSRPSRLQSGAMLLAIRPRAPSSWTGARNPANEPIDCPSRTRRDPCPAGRPRDLAKVRQASGHARNVHELRCPTATAVCPGCLRPTRTRPSPGPTSRCCTHSSSESTDTAVSSTPPNRSTHRPASDMAHMMIILHERATPPFVR